MHKLLYITNRLDIAMVAQEAGVDRIWIDLEVLGKEERQRNMNSVKSNHSIDDIRTIAPVLTKSEVLVRVNPWNPNSRDEITSVIDAGAAVVMLPYWKTVQETEHFIKAVKSRAKVMLLLETREAAECLERVVKLDGIDEILVGLNDLHLSYGLDFMFEPYSNGILEKISNVIRKTDIPFGIGGVGKFNIGLLPSPEEMLIEQRRLGATGSLIINRTFCDYQKIEDISIVKRELADGISILRKVEKRADTLSEEELIQNKVILDNHVRETLEEIRKKKRG